MQRSPRAVRALLQLDAVIGSVLAEIAGHGTSVQCLCTAGSTAEGDGVMRPPSPGQRQPASKRGAEQLAASREQFAVRQAVRQRSDRGADVRLGAAPADGPPLGDSRELPAVSQTVRQQSDGQPPMQLLVEDGSKLSSYLEQSLVGEARPEAVGMAGGELLAGTQRSPPQQAVTQRFCDDALEQRFRLYQARTMRSVRLQN